VKKALLLIVVLLIASPFIARAMTALAANGRVFTDVNAVPAKPVAVVYGAGIRNVHIGEEGLRHDLHRSLPNRACGG